MATLNQNGIDFNNVSFTNYVPVEAVVSGESANKIAAGRGSYVTNAVTIDWNGAILGDTTISTTGQLLQYIYSNINDLSAQYQTLSGHMSDIDRQLNELNDKVDDITGDGGSTYYMI